MYRKYDIGTVWSSNKYGDFEIVDIVSKNRFRVKFILTGFEKDISRSCLAAGEIRDPYYPIYYGVGTEYKGTIFTDLRDKTISDNTSFYNNSTIDETIERLESDFPIIIFWIFWVILIGGMVFGFYYLDNRWLD